MWVVGAVFRALGLCGSDSKVVSELEDSKVEGDVVESELDDVGPEELLAGESLVAVGLMRLRNPALGVKVFGVREEVDGAREVLVYGFGSLVWVSANVRDVVCGDEALLDVECVN